MKSLKFALPLMLAMVVSVGLKAADEKPAAAGTETKPADTKPAAGTEVTMKGALGEKPADAKAGIVATLKHHEKGAPKGDSKTLNLAATGDIATELTTLAGKKAHVEITGTQDGDTITVTKVTESKGKGK